MRYRLQLSDEALAQLRALRKEQRRRIGQRLDALQTDLPGDVKKPTDEELSDLENEGLFAPTVEKLSTFDPAFW